MTPGKGYDVAVIGAGPAGVAAAVSAAQHRASVILIDGWDRLGGSVTAGMHRCLCGLYSHAPANPLDTLNDGVQRSIVGRMLKKEPRFVLPRQLGKTWVLEFPTQAWEASLYDICSEAGIHLQLGTRVTDIRRTGSRISAVNLEGLAHGSVDVNAIIDCTGNGAVLELAGDDAILPSPDGVGQVLCGFSVRVSGLGGDPELLRLQLPYVLAHAVAEGKLPAAARFTTLYTGPNVGEAVCKLAVDPEELPPGELDEYADRIIEQLVKKIAGFAAAHIVEKSPRLLPRRGRALRGKYVLTEDDVLNARQWGPAAVHAWWPIELWNVSAGPTYAYLPANQSYDVPDDALRSAAIENLLAAGACLSGTPAAAASVRAGGICLATGQAAGRCAASLARA